MKKAVGRKYVRAAVALLGLGVVVAGVVAADTPGEVGKQPVVQAAAERSTQRVGAEVAVGGITPEERVAREQKLYARLIAEMPDEAQNDPITVELSQQDRDDLAEEYVSGTPLRIGVVKAISPVVQVARGEGFHRGDMQTTRDGGFVWAVTVTSPEAKGIRMHFTNFSLPPNAEMYFFSPSGAADGPYVGAGRNGNGDFWTRSISSDTGVIQLRYGGKAARDAQQSISFVVSELAHIHDREHLMPDVGTVANHDPWPCADNVPCLVDANCVSGTPADPAKDAVGKMEWIIMPYVYTCTGGLLVDTVPATQIPYFLTANHCFSASIANLETWFNYTTDSCNGMCPHNILTGGAPPSDTVGLTVLASSANSDFTLGTLDEDPPAGAVFLGWNNTPVAYTNGADLYRISNANLGPQVYSQQDVDSTTGTCGSLPRGRFIYSSNNTGGTMGGSSGSPVVNASSEVVGQLYGCCGYNCGNDCDFVNNWTVDGAFAETWPYVEEFLDPSGCTSDEECDDDNECTEDRCVDTVCQNKPYPNDTLCTGGVCCGGTCTAIVCSGGGDCDDSNECTTDTCTNPGTCAAACSNTPVADDTPCTGGVCCSATCTAPVCSGDVECDDSEPCTTDTCVAPTTCSAYCDNVWPGCVNGDGCCPAGCDSGNDSDCPSGDCGDGTCAGLPDEDCNSCPADCISGGGGAYCGDGICQPATGEDCLSCAGDCNGKQVGAAKRQFCCGDGAGTNPVGCDDSRCTTEGWMCSNDPADPYCCGDGTCEGGEDSSNCETDCPVPVCGDASCDPGEDQCNCPADCCAGAPATETACSDGCDNDCDGLTDGNDPDCVCGQRGDPCTIGADCCSGTCKRNGTCR